MGQAREIMNQITELAFKKDYDGLAKLHAPDAVSVTPDRGELRGRDASIDYIREVFDAFPDAEYEALYRHESGDTAIDEGYIVATHTQPLSLPSGESIPATWKQVRIRSCDVIEVKGGLVTSHRFYFDQMDFFDQLGLLPEMPV